MEVQKKAILTFSALFMNCFVSISDSTANVYTCPASGAKTERPVFEPAYKWDVTGTGGFKGEVMVPTPYEDEPYVNPKTGFYSFSHIRIDNNRIVCNYSYDAASFDLSRLVPGNCEIISKNQVSCDNK